MSDIPPQDLAAPLGVHRKSAEPPRGAEVPNGEELDQLISKAQELVRTLDTLTTSSAPTSEAAGEPEGMSSSAQEPTTLEELDRVLAADASAMLRTHAATVDAVLDHVFEERAALVQTLHAPPPAVDLDAEKEDKNAKPADALANIAVQIASTNEQEPVVEAPALVTQTAAVPPSQPMPVPQVAAVARVESKPVVIEHDTAAVEPTRLSQTSQDLTPQTVAVTAGRLFRPAIPLLVIMNFPIRMVPRSLRPMVDWVALSLAVWVPIVWLMVLTLDGKSEKPVVNPTDASSQLHTSSEHQSHEADPAPSHH